MLCELLLTQGISRNFCTFLWKTPIEERSNMVNLPCLCFQLLEGFQLQTKKYDKKKTDASTNFSGSAIYLTDSPSNGHIKSFPGGKCSKLFHLRQANQADTPAAKMANKLFVCDAFCSSMFVAFVVVKRSNGHVGAGKLAVEAGSTNSSCKHTSSGKKTWE